jgi:outer membrane protein TolC
MVQQAMWRVYEAQAKQQRAAAMWLPSIQAGLNYHRHDGNYQAIDGSIVDISTNSMQAGLGAGAIAAGTTTRPGLVAQFHLADAIFLPKAADRIVAARQHGEWIVKNQAILSIAIAYLDLLDAYQDESLMIASVARLKELSKITQDYALVGKGLVADAQRMSTEVSLAETRTLGLKEKKLTASRRLARSMSQSSVGVFIPADERALPLDLADTSMSEQEDIQLALCQRPEYGEAKEQLASVEALLEREKSAPYVPNLQVGYSTGRFGGGLGSNFGNWGGRYDIDALMTWELRNLGIGEQAARDERKSQVRQAMLSMQVLYDQIVQQITESRAQVAVRREQIEISEKAVESASDSYKKNLERIRQGQGLPIECLQSAQALEACERAYLKAISDYNRAQMQLLWARGWACSNAL